MQFYYIKLKNINYCWKTTWSEEKITKLFIIIDIINNTEDRSLIKGTTTQMILFEEFLVHTELMRL
jgi:hypothetical protein